MADISENKTLQTVTNHFGDVVHHLHLSDPNADLVLLQQAKMVGFQLKTGTLLQDVVLDPVPRSVKDLFRGN